MTVRSLVSVASVLPAVIAIVCVGAAEATPLPIASQPGATTPAQPGVTGPSQPGVTTDPGIPGITTSAAGVAPLPDEIAPASDYAPVRQLPHPVSVAPIRPERLHTPAPTPQVAPIVAPPAVVRFGDLNAPAPFLGPDQLAQVNSVGAGFESQISTAVRSIGIPPSRADSIASGAVAGAAAGAMSGAIFGSGILLTVIGAPLVVITVPLDATVCAAFGFVIGAGVGGLRAS